MKDISVAASDDCLALCSIRCTTGFAYILVFRDSEMLYFSISVETMHKDSPTQTGSGAMAAGRGESPEPDVLALILSPSSSDEEPD